MQTILDLSGLRSICAHEVGEAVPGGPAAGSVIVQCHTGSARVTIILPREVALSLHAGLDPWARAITEENDHGPSPSAN